MKGSAGGQLSEALRQREAAMVKVERVLRKYFPCGTEISWSRGTDDKRAYGLVLEHGYSDRIKVENDKTGGRYWIRASQIVC